MKKYLIVLVLFLIIGVLALEIYLSKNPFSEKETVFIIEKGTNLFQIADSLEKEGLIKNKILFIFYVAVKGNHGKLKAGEYSLNSSMGVADIAKKIISGEVAKITVTVPEGFTVKQIEERLGFELPGENLEGFLFPDTYHFPLRVSGEEVVKEMQENFEKKLTTDLREEIKKQGKTILETVTMASLLEKEVKTKEEKELASGILWKRLENKIPLQVDATITYVTGGKTTRVLKEDTQIDSPYNTYKYRGLPPGPICNPGLESILAAVYPEGSQYWYYLSAPDGKTYFSITLEEHNIKKVKYLK